MVPRNGALRRTWPIVMRPIVMRRLGTRSSHHERVVPEES
jgi:hypothetical protein